MKTSGHSLPDGVSRPVVGTLPSDEPSSRPVVVRHVHPTICGDTTEIDQWTWPHSPESKEVDTRNTNKVDEIGVLELSSGTLRHKIFSTGPQDPCRVVQRPQVSTKESRRKGRISRDPTIPWRRNCTRRQVLLLGFGGSWREGERRGRVTRVVITRTPPPTNSSIWHRWTLGTLPSLDETGEVWWSKLGSRTVVSELFLHS